MKQSKVKVGDRIVILHKGVDVDGKWRREGIVKRINKNLPACVLRSGIFQDHKAGK